MSKPSYRELEKELIALKRNGIESMKEEYYQNFFDNMADMVDVIELIYDKNGQAVDYYIRAINISFANFLDKTQEQLLNKKVSTVIDFIQDHWLIAFASVDKTGVEIRFKSYNSANDKYYHVTAWKVSENRIGVSSSDITKTEKAEIKLKENLKKEKKVRSQTEHYLKEKRVELQETICNLNGVKAKLSFQNEEKYKRANELATIKIELEQQNICLSAAAIVSETNADYNITFVNNRFCEFYGYKREELLGQNHKILKSEKQPDIFYTNMISIIRSGKVFKSEILHKGKGGLLFWMDITIMPFKDLKGKIIKYVAIMFDISSQTIQKEALSKQADQLANANTKLAFQNEEKEKRANELIIANKELAFQNEEKDKRANELAIANKELAFQNEEKEKRADELDIANKELAFQNEEKDKRAYELDIANKKLAFKNEWKDKRTDELAIIKVELEQQNSCLNKATIVSETDADFNITSINDNFCKLYGYQREELMGQNHRILKSGKQPGVFFTNMISTISSGKVFKGEVLNKKKGGQLFWMDITIMPFKDLNGNIIKYVAIMFDINSQTVQKEALLKQADELAVVNTELAFQNEEKEKRAEELVLANTELAFQNSEKQKRSDELAVANTELAFQNKEKDNRADELILANKEKQKRADELFIANTELAFQNEEKEKRAEELVLANTELAFQNSEKQKRSDELAVANTELAFQNKEKDNRADELILANKEKQKRADELFIANTELAFQNEEKDKRANELIIANEEKGKRANELIIANKELAFQNEEKEKRAHELAIANKELAFQNEEKDKRANELAIANEELAFQNEEKDKRANELIIANEEKGKRANELIIANKELAFQNEEKEKRAHELVIANKELAFQNEEKDKRANELAIANEELAFQNEEKDKRADELAIAKEEKGKRANELIIANKELDLKNQIDKSRNKSESIAKELRQFIETANAPIFGIDSKGLVNEWNQTSEKITGFKKVEVLGKNLVDTYITKDYRDAVKQVLDDALLGQETANFEFPLFAKDGQRVMVLLNSSTRRDADGIIVGVLGVGQDISEMDKLRTALTQHKENLESKVKERTRELELSLEREKELGLLKTSFVAMASHEFRTPLTAISATSDVIRRYYDKLSRDDINQRLEKIKREVSGMTIMLEDILIIGKSESQKLKYTPVHLDIVYLIKEIISEYQLSLTVQRILIYNISTPLIMVQVDKRWIKHIVLNLLSNAIKYSSLDKPIEINIKTNQDGVCFSFKDYGIGISKKDIKHLFEPFHRGENVGNISGTGLGLAVLKNAIDLHKAKIEIESEIGKGSHFKVMLPTL